MLFLALLPATLLAGDPAELAKLKASYETAIQKANAPINQTYQRELQRLKETFTRAARLEDALAVDAALKAATGVAVAATPNATTTPKAAAATPDKSSTAYKASTKIGESRYYVNGTKMNFDAASEMASQLGGRLAVITDDKLARRLVGIGIIDEAWIDASRDIDTKTWKASDGTLIPTTLLSAEAAATANPTTNASLHIDGVIHPSAPNRALPSIIEWTSKN